MLRPNVSVVVVSWNTLELLRACLKSLGASWPGGTLEVVVVDNGSRDGSGEMVKSEFPSALLLETGSNLGYSRAINRGIDLCTADFVCLLNSDTELTNSSLQTMVEFLRLHPEVGLLGPALVNPGGVAQQSRRPFPFFSRSLTALIGLQSVDDPCIPQKADWLAGACLVLPMQVIRSLGGLDEDYPFYGEDLDLGYRVHNVGLEVIRLPTAQVHHVHGGSSAALQSPELKVRSWYEAPLRFLLKHGSWFEVLFWRVTRGGAAAGRYLLARLIRRGESAEMDMAIWSGVVKLCISGSPKQWALDRIST